MKTLATCTPTEFLRQVNRIKHTAEKWLEVTDILNIRQRKPELVPIPENATKEEKLAAIQKNSEAIKKQAMANLSLMFDAIADKHPDETLEVLALCCFVEPEHVNDHSMGEYLTAITNLISDEAVIGFFTSLAQLNAMGSTGASKA